MDNGVEGELGGRAPGWEEATVFRVEVVNVPESWAGVVRMRGER